MSLNLNLVEVSVNIGGTDAVFSQMTLHQKMNSHHTCEILLDYDAFGDEIWMENPVKSINLIGENLSITMMHKATGRANTFSGLVSSVSFTGYHGANNHILIKGVSETIKLAGKPNMDSFVDKTLEEIVLGSVGTSGNGATIRVAPEYTNPIYFQMQYNESCFDFLNRLSYLYGESFYSKDGSDVYFGKVKTDETTDITYDIEMTEFNLDANLVPPRFKHYNYLQQSHEEKLKETRTSVPEAAGYLKSVLNKSEKIYTSEVNTPLEGLVHDPDSLLKMIDIERTRSVADMLVLSGKTQTCKVGLGKVVTVGFPDNMKKSTPSGAFIVTEVTHTVNKDGHYSNQFSGVRAALGYIPVNHVNSPIVGPQRATVVSNADPEGRGRIQVQMQFQKYIGKETNWIRVITPDAGAGARGYIFVPEVDDEVMIQFEENDPARPYCAGSVYAEPTARGGLADNHLKSIITRSGIKMMFNDNEGSLHIEDPSGNTWDMDGKGNIAVNAPNDITITAGKTMTLNSETMNVNVGENQTNSIGNNQRTAVGETIDIVANNMEEVYAENSSTTVGQNQSIQADNYVLNTATRDIMIISGSKVLVQGAKDARISKG